MGFGRSKQGVVVNSAHKNHPEKKLEKAGRDSFLSHPFFFFSCCLCQGISFFFFFFWGFPSLLCSLLYSTSHFFTFLVENRIGVSCCSSFFSPISSLPLLLNSNTCYGLYQSGIVCLIRKLNCFLQFHFHFCFGCWVL